MARSIFIIENEQDAGYAWTWIKNQFENYNFPNMDRNKQQQAKMEFSNLNWQDFKGINSWSEQHLKKDNWNKLKGAIRSGRLRTKRLQGEAEAITRVDMTFKAHSVLKSLATHYNATLSELILMKLEKEWLELPIEDKYPRKP